MPTANDDDDENDGTGQTAEVQEAAPVLIVNDDGDLKKLLEVHNIPTIYHRLGLADMTRDDNMQTKFAIRKGNLTWFHAEVTVAQHDGMKWISQCCRMAQRAGLPWSIRLRVPDPWEYAPLRGLAGVPGVVARRARDTEWGQTWWLTSAEVQLEREDLTGLVERMRETKATVMRDLAAVRLATDPRRSTDLASDNKRLKAAEDDEALGGLRTPHRSVAKLSGGRGLRRETADGD